MTINPKYSEEQKKKKKKNEEAHRAIEKADFKQLTSGFSAKNTSTVPL